MIAPPFNGMYWPTIETGSWEVSEYHELLRRGMEWCKEHVPAPQVGGA